MVFHYARAEHGSHTLEKQDKQRQNTIFKMRKQGVNMPCLTVQIFAIPLQSINQFI